jgi:hypothetical protein
MWLKLMPGGQTGSYCTFVFLTLLKYMLVNYVAQADARWSNWFLLYICIPGPAEVRAGQLCGSS